MPLTSVLLDAPSWVRGNHAIQVSRKYASSGLSRVMNYDFAPQKRGIAERDEDEGGGWK